MAQTQQLIKLLLPLPPSLNTLYAGKGRRYKSDDYKKWCGIAEGLIAFDLAPYIKPVIESPCCVTYRLGMFSDKRKRDIGNREKALSDALVSAKVLEDDHLIHRLVMEWAEDVQEGLVEVLIYRL